MIIKSLVNMINTTTPYAWDDSLSVYEFLGKIVSKLNEVVDEVNLKLPDDFETAFYEKFREYTAAEMQGIIDSGEFTAILDSMIVEFSPIKQEIIDARDGEVSIGAKIRSVDGKLTQLVTEVAEKTDPFNGYRFVGHRGCGLAPENTKPAIELSKKIGFNILEADLKLTYDKEWVVFHDDTVDRITNGSGNIETLTLAAVKELTITKGTINTDVYNTEKILTLDEMLDLVNKLDMYLMIEIKSIASAVDYQKVLDVLKRKNVLKKTMIHCFNLAVVESFYHLDPNLKLGWTHNGDITQYMIDSVKSWLGENCSLSSNIYNLTETGALLAKNNGVSLFAWNILNYDDIVKAFKLGCSYVISDEISEEMYNEYNLL